MLITKHPWSHKDSSVGHLAGKSLVHLQPEPHETSLSCIAHSGSADYILCFLRKRMYYKKREKQYFYVDKTGWTYRSIVGKQHTLKLGRGSCSSFSTEGGTFMAQQDEWQAHPINASRLGRQHAPNMEADDSPTF